MPTVTRSRTRTIRRSLSVGAIPRLVADNNEPSAEASTLVPTPASGLSETELEDIEREVPLPSSPLSSAPPSPLVYPALPPSPRPSSSSSSSSSDDEIITHPTHTVRMASSKPVAQVVSNGGKSVPSLTAGSLSPETLQSWEQQCRQHFRVKRIADDEQVGIVASGLQDTTIVTWFFANESRLSALSFKDFMADMRKRFLPRTWADDVLDRLSHSTQNENDSFESWVDNLLRTNALLTDTGLEFSEDRIREHITTHAVQELRSAARRTEARALKGFDDFKYYLAEIDESRVFERNKRRREFDSYLASRPRAFGPGSNANKVNVPSASARNSDRPPTLTEADKAKLRANGGCFKCRRYNAGHMSSECPNPFPLASEYTGIPHVPGKKSNTTPAQPTAGPSRPRPPTSRVAAVVDGENEPPKVADTEFVAAVAYPSCVLSSGSDSPPSSDYDSESDFGYVLHTPAPASSPHLVLHAHVASPLPLARALPMLIDSGCPTVLMREGLASTLGLRRRKLPEPRSLGVAFGGGKSEVTEWVKFRISLPDNSWTSRTVQALLVPGLCTPVILGLPFFRRNGLIIDPVDHSLTEKTSGRNLLDASQTPRPAPRRPSLREMRAARQERQSALFEQRILENELFDMQRRDVVRELQLEFGEPVSSVPNTLATPSVSTTPARMDNSSPPLDNPTTLIPEMDSGSEDTAPVDDPVVIVAALRTRIEQLSYLETLRVEHDRMFARYQDLFPSDIPHIDRLPTDVLHHFRLRDPNATIARRQYECPKKYREVWKELLEEHLAAGRLRPSTSQYASPAFLIPKADPTARPRWVNDYRRLNANTVPDVHPLPHISEILADCGRGRIWGKLDMTNSFFQTRVNPDDIPLTAVTTPFGLYEWTVMPQGCRNAPATHQRRMFGALRPYIGSICHVYLDDIIIWSSSLEEHRRNVATVLDALRAHSLFCSPKKTDLFCAELDFLGHHISERGVEADDRKVEKILAWPQPRNASHVRSFLGLVRYVASFLPALARYTAVLNPLTTKDAEMRFEWTTAHTDAFEAIKRLVTSRECLTVIDHQNLGENKIFVSCDASDFCTGAVLTYGPSPDTARPVAFESQQLKGAELNYPVHEKELFAIVRALKKWRVDLIGVPFTVFTDHRTLENFHEQKHLSRRQARWQEFLSQYDFDIVYVAGKDNVAADCMSRYPDPPTFIDRSTIGALWDATVALADPGREASAPRRVRRGRRTTTVGATSMAVKSDPALLARIKSGYAHDRWNVQLLDSLWDTVHRAEHPEVARSLSSFEALQSGLLDGRSKHGFEVRHGLLYTGGRLIVPRTTELRETFFRLAHDTLGHFGADKSYATLRADYYWPHMRTELESLYVPSCEDCQRNKSLSRKPAGPLHPLPVPGGRFESVAIDFIGPLPEDEGYDCIVSMTDRLGSDLRIVPCRSDMSAEDFADLFFRHWYCEHGLPLNIVSDRDKLFVSQFWRSLTKLSGVKLKMSTSFHPETDGSSERSNRTVIQSLRYHVERNQKGWVRALPLVRFNYMNSVNASTGLSPFQLLCGHSPRIIPPLLDGAIDSEVQTGGTPAALAADVLRTVETNTMEAQDNLLLAKTQQALQADRRRGPEIVYRVGDKVMLSTFHRRREYMQRGDHRVAKFMCRFDGPYTVVQSWPDSSVYTLDLPDSNRQYPTFHASLLRPFVPNDNALFPSRAHDEPGPVVTADGEEEFTVERILDRRRRGRGWQYLVRWSGYGPGHDSWMRRSAVDGLACFEQFFRDHGLPIPPELVQKGARPV